MTITITFGEALYNLLLEAGHTFCVGPSCIFTYVCAELSVDEAGDFYADVFCVPLGEELDPVTQDGYRYFYGDETVCEL